MSIWYEKYADGYDDGANPFAVIKYAPKPALHAHLAQGGRIVDFPRQPHKSFEQMIEAISQPNALR